MKTKLTVICLVILSLLAACTPYMYGVPQETWDRMSEPERIEAMRVYEREQQARRQAAEERARRLAAERERERERQAILEAERARERERERQRLAALEQARLERIEAIHRGDGAYGELIRVRLQGGRMRIGDRHHRYEPITFTIADGETRLIGVADRKGREVDLTVTYANGALTIDGLRFPYERRWGRGTLYAATGTTGPLALQGVDVFVEVRDRSSRFERDLPRLVIIREEPPPVVVREREPSRPPVVVREREYPTPPPTTVRSREHSQPAPRQPQPATTQIAQAPPVPPAQPILPQVVPTPPAQQNHQPAPPQSARQPVTTTPQPAQQTSREAVSAPRAVTVSLLSAEQKVRGRNQRVEPATVHLAEGESRDLVLKSGGETSTVTVTYRGGEVAIQGTPGKGRDGIHLRFEKDWKGGKVYRFGLKGKVMLENVELKVTGE